MPSAWRRVVASVVSKVTIGPESPKLLAGTGKDETHLLIVCTSDRGLAGGFNSNIVRAAAPQGRGSDRRGQDGLFLPRRPQGPAGDRAGSIPKQIIHQHDTSAMKAPSYADAQAIAKDIIDRYITDGIDVVHLVLRPLPLDAGPGAGRSSRSSRCRRADATKRRQRGSLAAVEYEPDEDEILADLLPRNVAVQIFRALLENAASDHGSRMTAMDNATRNAGDMINRLTIEYNRTRQAVITTELIEIISGAEAL